MVAVEVVAHAYLGSNPVVHCVAAVNSTAAAAAAAAAFVDAEVVNYTPGTDSGFADASTAAAVGIEGAAAAAGGGEDGGELVGGDGGVGSEEEEGMTMKLLLKLRVR